jgi:hypothetical protein
MFNIYLNDNKIEKNILQLYLQLIHIYVGLFLNLK